MALKTHFNFIHQHGDPSLRPLLLLHGTGGDEQSLLDIAKMVDPRRALLSPRGLVLENGMNRYFRRFAEGVLDEDDVRFRAGELSGFITDACSVYGLQSPIALGYSNGANIAAAILFLHPHVLSSAILLRSMAPLGQLPEADLSEKSVLLITGEQDQMITKDGTKLLTDALQHSKAKLTHKWLQAGHGIVQADIELITEFLRTET
jgi:phospholipase/carboxylesterase